MIYKTNRMADTEGFTTRSRSDCRKDQDGYFKSDVFVASVNKTITHEFERFLASESFKDLLFSTTNTVVSDVVFDTVG